MPVVTARDPHLLGSLFQRVFANKSQKHYGVKVSGIYFIELYVQRCFLSVCCRNADYPNLQGLRIPIGNVRSTPASETQTALSHSPK